MSDEVWARLAVGRMTEARKRAMRAMLRRSLRGKAAVAEDFEEFAEEVKGLARNLRAGVCPIWQCGGELEFLEARVNWQEPDLRCKNCGAHWLLQRRPGWKGDSEEGELVEALADLEHRQWETWSRDVARTLREAIHSARLADALLHDGSETQLQIRRCIAALEGRLERWKKNWQPYAKLSEEVKEYDRVWARKVLAILNKSEEKG